MRALIWSTEQTDLHIKNMFNNNKNTVAEALTNQNE